MSPRCRPWLFIAVCLLAADARSGTIQRTIRFDKPSVSGTGGGDILYLRGCRSIGMPGEPVIPVHSIRVLLPEGEKVSAVTIEPLDERLLEESIEPAWMPHQVPLGEPEEGSRSRNEPVYASVFPYPESRGELVCEQVIHGRTIAFINIYPCRVVPSTGSVSWSGSVLLTITTVPSTGVPPGPGRPLSARERARVFSLAGESAGPFDAPGLPETGDDPAMSVASEAEIIPYIIITSAGLRDAFAGLADIKRSTGIRTRIADVDSISAAVQGLDLQDKIRNFIRDASLLWQTEYVLLGGDVSIIPARGLYVKAGTEIEPDLISDLYYAALDGNWNSDGDSYYGEPGEEDLLPEVCVGRLPVESVAEVENFCSKLGVYSLAPPAGQCTKALMAGELLWEEPDTTWGGDYKDEILYGCSRYGFTTAGIPSFFESSTLYDRDLGSWNATQLTSILNEGVNLVNHLGHSNTLMAMRLPVWDLFLLENYGPDKLAFICYSQGCYAAAFDNRDDLGGYYAEDCIGEQLVTGPAGAVAFIGSTRLGWSAPGTTSSVSQYFDRQFFDALFAGGKGAIGEAFDDSRIDMISYISYAAVRYVMYGICLLGDPSMNVWRGAPSHLEVAHDGPVLVGGDVFSVEVSSGGSPVPNARASLFGIGTGSYWSSFTDNYGTADLFPSPDSSGSLLLVVSAPDHYPFSEIVPVEFPSGAEVVILDFTVDDDPLSSSVGDGDGIIEGGETVAFDLVVRNSGTAAAHDTRISLACQDPYISILRDERYIGEMPPRSAAILEDALILSVSGSIPNGRSIDLGIGISTSERQWIQSVPMTIESMGAALDEWHVSDLPDGNGNGCVEAWEYLSVHTLWVNTGNAPILSPRVSISVPQNSWAKITRHSEDLPDIPAGESASSAGVLQLFVREFTPPFTAIDFVIRLDSANLPSVSETLSVTVCGPGIDDDDGSQGAWAHEAVTGYDGWHVSSEDYSSAPSGWKCGGGSGEVYPNMMETALTTPPLCLYESSVLTFSHRMEAEAGSVYPYWAYDAGVVEISTDRGATWSIINPAAGYPCRASASNTIFLPSYQKCFSGVIQWRTETFDLSSYQGPVLLRFHFATDEKNSYSGWFVDDISVTTELATGDDAPAAGPVTALHSVRPNPFNPSTMIFFEIEGRARVELDVYDVAGRHIRSILDGELGPGAHTASWNGTDDSGRAVSSGVYFCRMRSGVYTAVKRLVLVR